MAYFFTELQAIALENHFFSDISYRLSRTKVPKKNETHI